MSKLASHQCLYLEFSAVWDTQMEMHGWDLKGNIVPETMFVQNKPNHKARKIFYSTCRLCFGSFLKILSNCFSVLAAVEVIIHLLMLFYKCLRQASFRLFEHFWVFSLTHMLLQQIQFRILHWMEMYPVSSCFYFCKSEAVCVWGKRHAIFVICSSVWGMFCSIGLLWILLLLQRQSCSWYSHTHTLKNQGPYKYDFISRATCCCALGVLSVLKYPAIPPSPASHWLTDDDHVFLVIYVR